MSRSIKVKGFFQDVGGASRVTKLRAESIRNASPIPDPKDFIRDLADALHPASMRFKVASIRDVSPTAKTFRLESLDGHIPVFQCGQYLNLRLKIGQSLLTRPYSISSAPYEARGERPFVEFTVRRNTSYLVPDYLFQNIKVGDELEGNMPFGTFYWEPLRDTDHIVALAGGSGVTPFVSMAKEIAYGKMKGCKLTLLFGSVKADDIICKAELDQVEKDCPDVKVVHILSDQPDWPGEKGFLSREILEKYSDSSSTFFFCGPFAMFTFVQKALVEMGVPERRFRRDVVGNPPVVKMPGYPEGTEAKTFRITVLRGLQKDTVTASAAESVAVALERAAIPVDTHCRNGECGFCRSQLISGEIFVSPYGDGRREMDKQMGWFHPCASWPLSDLTIKIPIL